MREVLPHCVLMTVLAVLISASTRAAPETANAVQHMVKETASSRLEIIDAVAGQARELRSSINERQTRPIPDNGLMKPATCLTAPLLLRGELRTGSSVWLDLVEHAPGVLGRQRLTDVAGKPVYIPVPSEDPPWLIMPKIESVSFQYDAILKSADSTMMRSGWFTAGQSFTRINSFKDNRDGTVDITIPVPANAMFTQPSSLLIKTDRCSFHVPITISPAMDQGRWFPPVVITQCASYIPPELTFSSQSSLEPRSRLERSVESARRHQGHIGNRLFHNCGPFGALHEGGNNEGVGRGSGNDSYLIWDGRDSGTSVDIVGDCNVKKTVTRVANDLIVIGDAAPREQLSKFAAKSVLHVNVAWRLDGPHDYCAYALVIRGAHPRDWSRTEWLTLFSSNNLGAGSSMQHMEGKSILRWRERDPENERRITVRTKVLPYD